MNQASEAQSDILDLAKYGLRGHCRCDCYLYQAESAIRYQASCVNPDCNTEQSKKLKSFTLQESQQPASRRKSQLELRPTLRMPQRKVCLFLGKSKEYSHRSNLNTSQTSSSGANLQAPTMSLLSGRRVAVLASFASQADSTNSKAASAESRKQSFHRSADMRAPPQVVAKDPSKLLDSKSIESLRQLFIENRLNRRESSQHVRESSQHMMKNKQTGEKFVRKFEIEGSDINSQISRDANKIMFPPDNLDLRRKSGGSQISDVFNSQVQSTNQPKESDTNPPIKSISEDLKQLKTPVIEEVFSRSKFIDPYGKQFSFCGDQLISPSKGTITFQERVSEASINASGVSFNMDKDGAGQSNNYKRIDDNKPAPLIVYNPSISHIEQSYKLRHKQSFGSDGESSEILFKDGLTLGENNKRLNSANAYNNDCLDTPSFNRAMIKPKHRLEQSQQFIAMELNFSEAVVTLEHNIRESADSNVRLSSDRNESNSQPRDLNSSFDLNVAQIEADGSLQMFTDKSSPEGESTNLSITKELPRQESHTSIIMEDDEKEAEEIKQRIQILEQECQNFFKKRDLTATVITIADSKCTRNELASSPRDRIENSCDSLRSASPSTLKFDSVRTDSAANRMGSNYPGLAQFLKISRLQTQALARIADEQKNTSGISKLLKKYLGSEPIKGRNSRSTSMNVLQAEDFLSKTRLNQNLGVPSVNLASMNHACSKSLEWSDSSVIPSKMRHEPTVSPIARKVECEISGVGSVKQGPSVKGGATTKQPTQEPSPRSHRQAGKSEGCSPPATAQLAPHTRPHRTAAGSRGDSHYLAPPGRTFSPLCTLYKPVLPSPLPRQHAALQSSKLGLGFTMKAANPVTPFSRHSSARIADHTQPVPRLFTPNE
jgi:hypothetical protein